LGRSRRAAGQSRPAETKRGQSRPAETKRGQSPGVARSAVDRDFGVTVVTRAALWFGEAPVAETLRDTTRRRTRGAASTIEAQETRQ
jgi:hypothetical protein